MALEAVLEMQEEVPENLIDDSSRNYISNKVRNVFSKVLEGFSNYAVDVSVGLAFYNPIMAAGERLIAGMSYQEIGDSRFYASAMQLIFMRPIGKMRNISAKHFGLTKESHWMKKWASDVGSTLLIQLPTYGAALYALGREYEQMGKALALSAAVTSILSRPFGKVQDKWRKYWGKEAAIK